MYDELRSFLSLLILFISHCDGRSLAPQQRAALNKNTSEVLNETSLETTFPANVPLQYGFGRKREIYTEVLIANTAYLLWTAIERQWILAYVEPVTTESCQDPNLQFYTSTVTFAPRESTSQELGLIYIAAVENLLPADVSTNAIVKFPIFNIFKSMQVVGTLRVYFAPPARADVSIGLGSGIALEGPQNNGSNTSLPATAPIIVERELINREDIGSNDLEFELRHEYSQDNIKVSAVIQLIQRALRRLVYPRNFYVLLSQDGFVSGSEYHITLESGERMTIAFNDVGEAVTSVHWYTIAKALRWSILNPISKSKTFQAYTARAYFRSRIGTFYPDPFLTITVQNAA